MGVGEVVVGEVPARRGNVTSCWVGQRAFWYIPVLILAEERKTGVKLGQRGGR